MTSTPQDVPNPDATEPLRPRALRRRSHDRALGGVCGGFADFTGIDLTLLRVLTVVLTLLTAGVPVVYVTAWLLVPEVGADRSALESWFRR